MSTTVYQNFLHSNCFDTQATTLNLKVPPPPPPEVKQSLEFGNWGFFQTGNIESCYSHSPGTKPSFSSLSAKSLELCTENLGSETGSDIVTDGSSIFSCSPPLSPSSISSGYSATSYETDSVELEFGTAWKDNYVRNYHQKETNYSNSNLSRKGKEFPPPLTTMTGSSSLRVHRHTEEGGRLIIEAVETPFRSSYLQAERSDGRLRLCFVTDAEEPSCSTDAAGNPEEEEIDDGVMAAAEEEEEIEDCGTKFESEKEEFDGDQNPINREMGMEKFQRPSRCKDGSHGRGGLCCNWKPSLCVILT